MEGEVTGCMSDWAEYLLTLCSSSSACKVKKLISVLCRKECDLKALEENGSSVADCQKITNVERKRCLVKA